MPQLDFLTFVIQIVLSLSLLWVLLFNFVLIFLAEYIVFDTNKKTLWRYLNKLSSLRKWFAFGVLSTALIQQSIFLRPVKRWCTWFIKHTKECVFNFTRLLVGFTKFQIGRAHV